MVFLDMRNGWYEETARWAGGALQCLSAALPQGWAFGEARAPRLPGRGDGLIDLTGPGGSVTFTLQLTKGRFRSSDEVGQLLRSSLGNSVFPVLYLSDYISSPLRARCEAIGVNYADATGWSFVSVVTPLVVVRTVGASRDPGMPVRDEQVQRLSGRASGRLIGALLDLRGPAGVRELAKSAGLASPGSVSKTLPTLVASGAVDRDEAGRVVRVRKRTLLERWTADYSYFRGNGVVMDFLAPRGVSSVVDRLRGLTGGYSVTAGVAGLDYLAADVVPVVPQRRLVLYGDPSELRSELADVLIRSGRDTSNVIIAAPSDPRILTDPVVRPTSLPSAPLHRVLADIMSMPGREALFADQLIEGLAVRDPWWKE